MDEFVETSSGGQDHQFQEPVEGGLLFMALPIGKIIIGFVVLLAIIIIGLILYFSFKEEPYTERQKRLIKRSAAMRGRAKTKKILESISNNSPFM